ARGALLAAAVSRVQRAGGGADDGGGGGRAPRGRGAARPGVDRPSAGRVEAPGDRRLPDPIGPAKGRAETRAVPEGRRPSATGRRPSATGRRPSATGRRPSEGRRASPTAGPGHH